MGSNFIRITAPTCTSLNEVLWQLSGIKVLEPIVRLHAVALGPTFVLMDDNTRPHRPAIIDDYLESKGIACMAWPAYSPDLNPIENL